MVKSLSATTAVQVIQQYYFINHNKTGIKKAFTLLEGFILTN
jgi:hypothetical protein